jgi:hypothetical protein
VSHVNDASWNLQTRFDVALSSRTLKQAKAAQFAGPGVAVATALLQLVRIRTVRAELMKAFNLESSSIVQLNRSAALDRYQRFAHTKRRRAARKLEGN